MDKAPDTNSYFWSPEAMTYQDKRQVRQLLNEMKEFPMLGKNDYPGVEEFADETSIDFLQTHTEPGYKVRPYRSNERPPFGSHRPEPGSRLIFEFPNSTQERRPGWTPERHGGFCQDESMEYHDE